MLMSVQLVPTLVIEMLFAQTLKAASIVHVTLVSLVTGCHAVSKMSVMNLTLRTVYMNVIITYLQHAVMVM